MLSEDPSGRLACLRSSTALEMPQLDPSPNQVKSAGIELGTSSTVASTRPLAMASTLFVAIIYGDRISVELQSYFNLPSCWH